MGLYDTFHYICPSCGKDASAQTKMGECELHSLTIGCEFPVNGIIAMKEPCECGEYASVVVDDHIIMSFKMPCHATIKESNWGQVDDVKHEKPEVKKC